MGIAALLNGVREVFDDTYADSVLASRRLLELATPLLSQVHRGELQLPYEIVPKGEPQTNASGPGLVTTGSVFGFPIKDYNYYSFRTITSGPLVLREASVFEGAGVRLKPSAYELAYHVETESGSYLAGRVAETIDDFVQFVVGEGRVALTNVLRREVPNCSLRESQPKGKIVTYDFVRLSILEHMVSLLEARNLSLKTAA